MQILLYQWEAYGERGLLKGLREMGYSVTVYDKKINNYMCDEKFYEELLKLIICKNIEIVISFNFFPLISDICKQANRKYVSWIFSNPHYSLYCDSIFYNGNYIFCFDREQFNEFRNYGIEHVYHLPLAVDCELFAKVIKSGEELRKYDISFVGTLYSDERDYFGQIKDLPDYVKGYTEGICEAQLKIFGYNLVKDVIPDYLWQELKRCIGFHMDEGYFLTFEKFITDIINKRVTILERERLLSSLSDYFNVNIFTSSDTVSLPKVVNGGYIHYYEQMPRVFASSKINLNITLRSIFSGIPLRVLDILACRGLALTNFQPEIAEYFEEGKEIIMYGSEEELREKCHYYLQHEEIREQIIENGHKKVREQFSYKEQLVNMFSVI